eukprot:8859831-Pyramimonas_sp.AAC.1
MPAWASGVPRVLATSVMSFSREELRAGPSISSALGGRGNPRAHNRASGLNICAPWRAGVPPSASHGDGLDGPTGAALMKH